MLRVQGFDPATPPRLRRRVVGVLAVAVLGISSSAVLVRGMHDAEPVAIAAWRTLGAAVLLAPGIAAGRSTVGPREAGGILLAGFALAAHFALWFASLDHTTVLRSTVLVCLVPLWTGMLEWLLRRQAPRWQFWAGVCGALPGVALMSTGEGGADGLLGDALATAGGFVWAIYFHIGRSVRQRVPIAAYMGLVCAAACLPLWPAALWLGQPLTGYAGTTWILLLGATLGPQLLGHQGSAYAVRYLPASVVAAVMLLEPVGATTLAALALGEIPPARAVLGGSLVVCGVIAATLSRAR